MYKNNITIEELAKILQVSKYIEEDGTYIMEWTNEGYFNDLYEIEDYKVFITSSYNYFNSKLGIINVNDKKTYVILIKISNTSEFEDKYNIIYNYTNNYIFTYKMGLLCVVECINKKTGRIEYSKFMKDYSYNIIDTDWLRTVRKKIIIINNNNKLVLKIKHNKIKLTSDNGNYVIFVTIENIISLFDSYPEFQKLRNHFISLIF